MILKITLLGVAICTLALAVYFYAHHNWHPLPLGTTIDRIVVEKAARKLSIFRDGRPLKTYRVALSRSPIRPKEKEGDMKTPEGIYKIDSRNAQSSFISRCTFRIRQMMITRAPRSAASPPVLTS